MLIFLVGCKKEEIVVKMNYTQVKKDLELIKDKRIFFGHQSVGNNILHGIEDLIKETGVQGVQIIDVAETSNFPEHFFAHTRVGQNKHPFTKIESFKDWIDSKFKGELDLVILKFCYVDFTPSTKPEKIFNAYKDMIEKIHMKYPKLKILHMTAPVVANSGGIKIRIKRLIGKEDYTDPANIVRNKYGTLLKNYFGDSSVFDIARVEAQNPNGSFEQFERNGVRYYSLLHAYTYDGGHLNKAGRLVVAEKFIRAIANLLQD
jgi:lysophospholipase L1-like esterase